MQLLRLGGSPEEERQRQNDNQSKKNGGELLITIIRDVAFCSTREETCLQTSSQDVEWIGYTAASYHVTSYGGFLKTYKVGNFGTMKIGNTSFKNIIGTGDVKIKTNIGYTITLKDIHHVPDLRLNFLLGKAFDKEGYNNYFWQWHMENGESCHGCCPMTYLWNAIQARVKIYADSLNVIQHKICSTRDSVI